MVEWILNPQKIRSLTLEIQMSIVDLVADEHCMSTNTELVYEFLQIVTDNGFVLSLSPRWWLGKNEVEMVDQLESLGAIFSIIK